MTGSGADAGRTPTALAEGPAGPWTVLRVIRSSADWLVERGVESARLDAEHLLAHALGTTRLQLYPQYDRPLDADELDRFRPLLRRRGGREPLQYITGRAAFRELELAVDPRVLIPRPETEVLVQVVLDHAGNRTGLVALDVGTGSGCIALSLVREGPFARVVGTDPSEAALEVARDNAVRTGLESDRLEFRRGADFDAVPGERFDVIVSNPPYVARSDAGALEPEVRDWEPATALFGGGAGTDVLYDLVDGAADHLAPGGLLALEVGLGQAEAVRDRLAATGRFTDERIHRDLTGRPRIVTAAPR